MDGSGRDGAECSRKVASGRRVAGAIQFLVNDRDLLLEYARILHETFLVSVLMYGEDNVMERDRERSRVRAVQMDNLRGLLGIRRMYAWIWELCGVKKGLDEKIDEAVLWWFGHVERMERDRIDKRVYVGVCW